MNEEKENIFDKRNLIIEYINEDDCIQKCENKLFNCDICNHLEECYASAKVEYNDEVNDVFVETINCGGYESQEEFWNELLE